MDHHMTDGGAVAPETAGAGPRGPVRPPGGPAAGDMGGGAGTGRVRGFAPDTAATGSARGGGAGTAPDRVWAVLLFRPDPVDWQELARVAGVSRVEALEALLAFENAGFVLHIPARRGRFPHGDLWVLAGGVREQQHVADAVSVGLLAKLSSANRGRPGWDADAWQLVLEAGVAAPPVPLGPVTGLPVLPRGWLKELVIEKLAEAHPQELSVVALSQRLGGRSSGAIRIAADELCRDERAVCTDPQVKKYAALRPDGAPVNAPAERENLA
jgi:hypothetical protein